MRLVIVIAMEIQPGIAVIEVMIELLHLPDGEIKIFIVSRLVTICPSGPREGNACI